MQILQGSYLTQLMKECVELYIANNHPPITIKNLRNFLNRFDKWLDGRELTVKECRLYVKDMQRRLAHSSATSDTGRLQMFLKWLHKDAEITEHNWAKDVFRPVRKGEQKEPEMLLAPEKLTEYIIKVTEPGKYDHAIHREAKKEHREFLFFLQRTGLRPNEAIKINPKRVNLHGSPPSVLILRKGGKWKSIGLPLDYLEPVRVRVEQGRWFNVSQTTLQRYMRKISVLAGQTVKLYSIRKSVDTFMLDAGAPLMQAAEAQGHTVAIMQKDYVKFSAKHSSEVQNTYNPYVNRAELPVEYMIPHLQKLAKECKQHPKFEVEMNENSLVIKWAS